MMYLGLAKSLESLVAMRSSDCVGKMRQVRLRLISASNNCRVKVRVWIRFRVRRHIEVA